MTDAPVVAITGAGSGIGHGLARRFRTDGFRVAGCDLPGQLEAAEDACGMATACDVTDPGETESFVTAVVEEFGQVDALIANAGIGRIGPIATVDWADIEDVVRVNLFGVLHSFRAALGPMRQRGRGRLVAVVSRNAELCPSGLVGYNASKAAVIATVRTLAHELRQEGVDVLVNNLIPGPTLTALNPRGEREPDACYPTARMLVSLPSGGPNGRTFFDEEEYPMWGGFSARSTGRPAS